MMILRICIVAVLMSLPCWSQDQEAELAEKVEAGNAAFEEAAYGEALEAYDSALETSPKSSVVHYNRANVLFRQGTFAAAVEAYREAAKHKPKKHLLRNIHFNLGNSYYRQAQQLLIEKPEPEEPKTEPVDGTEDPEAETAENSKASYLDKLNQALGLFEDANNEYRTSLALDRKISIAEGRDLRSVGTYAKKNWALARKAWTEVREEIRKLERQNLKLRDGINSLLQMQRVNFPRLETVYLQSFSEDALKYRLKVLAEYQIDNTDSLERLRELAVKDVERVMAELENHKTNAAAASADPAAPQQPNPEDPELARLELSVKQTTQIRDAVIGAAGLENFVVDALKRGKPLIAWRNLGQMVELLQELVTALDSKDPVAAGYGQIAANVGHAEQLRLQAVGLQEKGASGPYADLATRSVVLAGEKVRTTLDGEDPAKQPGAFSRMDMVLEQLRKASQEAATPPPQQEGAPPPSPVAIFYQKMPSVIMEAAIDEAKRLNAASRDILKKADGHLFQEPAKPALVVDLPTVAESCQRATTLVKTAQQPIAQLFTTTIGECDTLADRLAAIKPADIADENLVLANELPLLDVLLFEYGVVQKKAVAESATEFTQLKDALAKNLGALTAAQKAFDSSREAKTDDAAALAKLNGSLRMLRMTLLQGLLILDPDAAVNLYFDRLITLQGRMAEALPSTNENWVEARQQGTQFVGEINQLATLLQQFVDASKPAAVPGEDAAAPQPPADPQIAAREKSLGLVRRASTTAAEAHRFLSQKVFPKRDLLTKGLALDLQKARLAYQQKPGEATEALQLGIDWQGQLKEQNTEASAIAIQLGQDKDIGGYMARAEGDVLSTAGIAAAKIREMQDAAKQGGGAAMPFAGGRPVPGEEEPDDFLNTLNSVLKKMTKALMGGGAQPNLDIVGEALEPLREMTPEQLRKAGLDGVKLDTPKTIKDGLQLVRDLTAAENRRMDAAAKQGGPAPSVGVGPMAGGQPGPQHKPETLDEALKLVQDAILEGTSIKKFLANAEFHNAGDKHDRVVDLLTQALELLKQDDEQQDQDQEQDQDQQGEQDQQQGQDQQQNQDQQGQQDQQAGDDGQEQRMTPEQARRLLNQLNNQDNKDKPTKAKAAAGTVNTPRPW